MEVVKHLHLHTLLQNYACMIVRNLNKNVVLCCYKHNMFINNTGSGSLYVKGKHQIKPPSQESVLDQVVDLIQSNGPEAQCSPNVPLL